MVVLTALALEALFGYPAGLHARLPHPVVWVGCAIRFFEARWNQQRWNEASRRLLGALTVALLASAAIGVGWIIQHTMPWWAVALIGTLGLAQRSLYQHVRAVLVPLREGKLIEARAHVSRIVGRDTSRLGASGVAAAALESLAESFNDGVLAPAFWFAVAGLPGLFAYKVLNTADSLIGHKEDRWRAFGWAAARADDGANLIPARVAGLLLGIAAGGRGLSVMFRDASKHASPNAGWPEAAMAGALGVRLGGLAYYDGVAYNRPVFGRGHEPEANDLARGLRVYVLACGLLWAVIFIVERLWPRS